MNVFQQLEMYLQTPFVQNALIVGVMLHVAFGEPLWMSMLTVGAGEALACFVLGIPLVKALEKVPGLYEG